MKNERNFYISFNSDGVKKDLASVQNHRIPPSKINHFIKWASIERTMYENDIYDEISTYLQCKYDVLKEWIRLRKTEKFFEKLVERDGAICSNKLCLCTNDLTIDHIIPPSLGGSHTLPNMRILCRRCNSSKGKKLEWNGIVKNKN